MAKQRIKVRINWKSVLYIALALLLLAGIGFGIYSIVDKSKTTEIRASAFSIGGLSADGKYKETKASIYTKDAFECQGLTVTPKFESNVSYELFFYDSVGKFINSTGRLTTVYKEKLPLDVTHCRVVITPIEDEEISLLEVRKYANQITIEVNKTQKTTNLPIKGSNLLEYHTNVEVVVSQGVSHFGLAQGEGTKNASDLVSTVDCTKFCIRVKTADMSKIQIVYLAETTRLGMAFLSDVDGQTTVDGAYTYLVANVPTDCKGIMIFSETAEFADAGIYVW